MMPWCAASAFAWSERGPNDGPTGREFPASERFAEVAPDWSHHLATTAPLDLASVARGTADELRRQQAEGRPYASPGLFGELGITLRDVIDTLDWIARIAIEDRGSYAPRLRDPSWLASHLHVFRWSPDHDAADARGVPVDDGKIRLTQYVVYAVTGSPVWTVVHDTPLYALPEDERAGGPPGDRLRYTRPDVYAGVYEPGGAAAGRAKPLVWLMHHDVNEALMQGTVEVTMPDGSVRVFNVHENNGRPYNPAVEDDDLLDRYWYFREVPGILGVEQIPLRPGAAVAGDVWNLGLGKLVALGWGTAEGPELRLAVLADTGGAFEPNLFQLDWLAGTFAHRDAWEQASSADPTHADAWVLVREDAPVRGTFAALLGVPIAVAILAAVLANSGPREHGHARVVFAGRRPVPALPTGPLAGVVVYLSAGHGWLLHRQDHDGEPIGWGSQRPRLFGLLEDEWTASFVADDLAPALEEAGATVIALRERDRNPVAVEREEVGPDVDSVGIDRVVFDSDASVGRALRLDPGGAATWLLTVPDDGQWYAYARWVAEDRNDAEAIYTVRFGDDVRETVVDQRSHGGHWWPLGDACLPKGSTVEITLTGSGTASLSADAVRIGGGTGAVLVPYAFTTEFMPYSELAMAHQLERLGGPASIGYYDCGNVVSDMRLRPRWASWASPPGEDALYLSIHTNASEGGPARGLTVFYGYDTDPVTPPQAQSITLATELERSVHDAVSATDGGYLTRGVLPGNFSEISPVHNALPAALLEMGFHDDAQDARRLQTQAFKTHAAEGIVEGVVRWHDRAN